jgi:hypothetical protein
MIPGALAPAAANPARRVLVGMLVLSAAADAIGGAWAVLDWRGVAALMAGMIPDWSPVARAARHGLEDVALHQLWANLGTTLLALGVMQGLAAAWVAGGRREGLVLARWTGGILIGAGVLLAGPGGQLSALATEGVRGAAILLAAVRAAPRPE